MDFIFTYRTRTSSRAESPAGSGGPDASPARGSRVTRRSGFGGGGRGDGRGGTGSLVSPEEEAKRCQTSRWPHKLRNAAQHLTSTTEEHFLLQWVLEYLKWSFILPYDLLKIVMEFSTVWASENLKRSFLPVCMSFRDLIWNFQLKTEFSNSVNFWEF